MGRRRNRDDDFLELILKLVGLAIMLCVITPQGRALLVTLGLIAAWAAVLAVGGLVAFLIYRKVRADKNLPEPAEPESDSFKGHLKSVFRIPWPDDGEVEEPAEPAINSTAELLDRLRAIDWFQFEKVVALAYAWRKGALEWS